MRLLGQREDIATGWAALHARDAGVPSMAGHEEPVSQSKRLKFP